MIEYLLIIVFIASKSVASIIEDVLEEVTPISVAEIKEEVEIIEEQERVEAQSEPPVLSNSETSGTFLDQMNMLLKILQKCYTLYHVRSFTMKTLN